MTIFWVIVTIFWVIGDDWGGCWVIGGDWGWLHVLVKPFWKVSFESKIMPKNFT